MTKLTSKQRNALPDSAFALPSERKYPITDKAHAKNAKARVQQEYDRGDASKSLLKKVDSKANKMLGKKK